MSEKKVIRLKARVTYKGSTQTATVDITPFVVKNAYFATKKEEKVFDSLNTKFHTVAKYETLKSIAALYSTTEKELLEQNTSIKNGKVKEEDFLVYIPVLGKKITFDPITKVTVGDEAYLVVDTKDLKGKTIKIKIHQGKQKVLADVDKAVTLLHNGNDAFEFKAVVGELADKKENHNKAELKNLAVTKITLAPKQNKDVKKWNDEIEKLADKKTLLYLYVEADIKEKVKYYGENADGTDNDPKRFCNIQGKWLELKYKLRLNPNPQGFSTNNNITVDHILALEKGRPSMSKNIIAIILHRTVSSGYPGSWMKAKTKIKGAHFYVDKNGTVYQTASLNISVAHLYASSSKQMYAAYYGKLKNSNTVGIEVVGNYINGKWEPLTKKQIEATSLLVAQIKGEYNIKNSDIYPHEKVQRKTSGEGKTVLDAIDLTIN